MAYTDPRTWVTGELVTSALLNVQIRDNFDAIIEGTTGAYVNAVTGPHAIGGSTVDYVRLGLTGAFTSGGASTVAFGTYTSGAITGHSGDSAAIAGVKLNNTIVTAGNCTTIAQLWVSEPQITVGAGSVTNSASVYVEGAATEATNDYALWVASGTSRFDGTVLGINTPHVNEGRLTLTSGTAVTTADVTGAGTVYFALDKGDQIALYDGSSAWNTVVFAEMSLALSGGTASRPNDIFLDYNDGTPQLTILAWTNDTTRATALVKQDGVWVRTGDTQQRYLGTLWLDSSKECEDSNAKRHCWNLENQRVRPLKRVETTDSWTYTTASYRQANGSSANQVEAVLGVAQAVEVILTAISANSGNGRWRMNAIGLDGTSASGITGRVTETGGEVGMTTSAYSEITAVGRYYLVWLEMSSAGDTTTWYGDNGGTAQFSGMVGSVMG